MKLVDANLLLYAVNTDAPLHARAHEWLDQALNESEPMAMAWTVILAFVRISTRSPGPFTKPLAPMQAFDLMDNWLRLPNVTIIQPIDRHFRVLRDLLNPTGTAGNLVPDAHLAALAVEHGATLYSTDNDFSRFAGLRWINPLK